LQENLDYKRRYIMYSIQLNMTKLLEQKLVTIK